LQSSLSSGINALSISGNTIYAGSVADGIFMSTNLGVNWAQSGLANLQVLSLASSGNTVYAATVDSGVYVSTNGGINWFHTPVNTQTVFSVTTLGNKVFAGTTNVGVVYSTNNGAYWSQTALNNQWVYELTGLANYIVAASHGNGIYLSSNYGNNWAEINDGFTGSPVVNAFLLTTNHIFAATSNNSVWRRPISDLVGIQNTGTGIPLHYSLEQNYPNPFNPGTVIRFNISGFPSSEGYGGSWGVGMVTLKVYDIMGREVQTLVNESLKPGTYEVAFDGSMLNSGVYFYKLITNSFTETKRMLLVK
jgi:hypothetical protein